MRILFPFYYCGFDHKLPAHFQILFMLNYAIRLKAFIKLNIGNE